MRESAIVLTGLRATIVASLRTWNPDDPMMIPITMYPTTWGILSF